jgi:hypothetical protein
LFRILVTKNTDELVFTKKACGHELGEIECQAIKVTKGRWGKR